MRAALEVLEEGKPARVVAVDDEDRKAWRMLQLLTTKPVLYVCNVSEDDAANGNAHSTRVAEMAAEQGNANAQTNLGVMYHYGQGVPKDNTEAVKWFRMAADQGYPGAQLRLGLSYVLSKGVSQDHSEAFKWFRRAAEQGHADAQYMLGAAYATGSGVPENTIKAYVWMILSKAQGNHSDALIQYMSDLKKTLAPEHIVKAQEMAERCLESNHKDCD